MEFLKTITPHIPGLFYVLIAIICAGLVIRFVKNLITKVILVVVILLIAGVLTVRSSKNRTEIAYERGDQSHTVIVSNDENGKITGVDYEGTSSAMEVIDSAKDALKEDIDTMKNNGTFDEIKDNMQKGVEEGGKVLDWIDERTKNGPAEEYKGITAGSG